MNNCPKCGKGPVTNDVDAGETYCTKCGFIIEDKVQTIEPESRGTDRSGKSKSRTGLPMDPLRGFDLSTTIDKSSRDASGRQVPGKLQGDLKRWRIWDQRSSVHGPIDRNIRHASLELKKLCEKLSLPSQVAQRATYIYKRALSQGIVKGRSIPGIAAASTLMACRELNVPRTLKDVSASSNVNKKDLGRCYRLLVGVLDAKIPIARPELCVPKIASRLQLGEKIQRTAYAIIREAAKRGMTAGKDPMGFAAAAIYKACKKEGMDIAQKEIARVSGVTEVTVRNRFKGLSEIEA